MPAERRNVTVVFADVSGFTGLSESMDPEDVQELIDALFKRFRSAIEREGGAVDKFIGDAVMALFGAPVAHADDPARAVRASLQMQKEAVAFAAERRADLRVRIGVNAGEVLWGSVGGDRPTATGDAVNVAQRLESAAEPGSVLVSLAVARAAPHAARYGKPQIARVKGRGQEVEACVAEEVTTGQTELRLSPAASAPFVGRETELADLMRRFKEGALFAVVEGEAGVGKSRLAGEFRRRLRASAPGLEALAGRVIEAARLPLAPFAEIASAAGGRVEAIAADLGALDLPAMERENLADLVALSAGWPVGDSRVRFGDPLRAASETRRAWSLWFESRARNHPVLLYLEDIHWADPGTLALLEHLAAGLRGKGVGILATARPGVATPAGFEKFPLDEIAAADATDLARRVAGAGIDEATLAAVVAQAGGHPLYIEELARHLSSGSGGAPSSLAAVLVARLDTLPAETKETLKIASVFGRVFWLGLLESLGGSAASLEEAAVRGLVASHPSSLLPGERELVFRHALIREAAYGLLPKRERTRLHAAAAQSLEARRDAGRGVLSLAAAQREAAGDAAGAARDWIQGSLEAARALAFGEAESAARDAVRLDPTDCNRVMLAEQLRAGGNFREACEEARKVIARAGAAPADAARADAVTSDALYALSDFAGSLAVGQRALASPPDEDFRRGAAIQVMRALINQNRVEEASAIAVAEEPRLRATRDRAHLMALLSLRAQILWIRGDRVDTVRLITEAISLAREIGDERHAAAYLGNLGLSLHVAGDLPASLGAFEESLQLQRRIGDRWGIAKTLGNMGTTVYFMDRHEEAQRLFSESLELSGAIGHRAGVAVALAGLSNISLDYGNLEEAERLSRESLSIRTLIGDSVATALVQVILSRILRLTGHVEEALSAARIAIEEFDRAPSPQFLPAALRAGAFAAAASGRLEEAEAFLKRYAVSSAEFDQDWQAETAWMRGNVFRRVDPERARAGFERFLAPPVSQRRAHAPASARAAMAAIAARVGLLDEARSWLAGAIIGDGSPFQFEDRMDFELDLVEANRALGNSAEAERRRAAALDLALKAGDAHHARLLETLA
ncbi:MAG: adenylate/guanylate cyclase domain-containing protein [Planctomycetota bacterium]